jgi:DNA-directed RNA polymerase subunit K
MNTATRFEKARLVSARALQLAFGAPPLLKAGDGSTPYLLAKKELEEGVLPLTVIRRFSDGRVEKIGV